MSDDQDKSEAFQRGYTAGYQARCREEVASYFEAITAGQQIYDNVIRGLINVPTYAERNERRLAVLREAHAAELHAGRDPKLPTDCPVCLEARTAVIERADLAAWIETHAKVPLTPWQRLVVNSYLPPGKPHSGHYGVCTCPRPASDEEINSDGGHRADCPRGATIEAETQAIIDRAQNPDYVVPGE